ncbi:MAG: peptidylprolyl isomerase [Gemmatimonadota bacterium]
MKRSSLLVLAVSASSLVACSGLNDAFSAHVDTVAKAGSQELTVTRLGDMIGKAKLGLPVNRDVAMVVSRDLWVPYQLLAMAAARGDSLADTKAIDAAAIGLLENARISKFMQGILDKVPADSGGEAAYLKADKGLFSARHILFKLPDNPSPIQRDSLRRAAMTVLATVNDANFAELAAKYSADNTKDRGGNLGVFPISIMVKPFADALTRLKPGEISKLVVTQFGYHIIQRNTWERAKTEYAAQAGNRGKQVAESLYVSSTQRSAVIELKSDAATTMKELARDPIAARASKTVLATFKGGKLTAGKLALVLLASPNAGRLLQQVQGAPDSLVERYVTQMAQREVLLQRADSAGIQIPAEELATLHRDFTQAVVQSWGVMRVDPKMLADSAATPEARERLAAARVEAYVDHIMAGEVQPMPVPAPLQIVLMDKFSSKINQAGIERAVERARGLRSTADSAKAAAQPSSAVPLPGAAGPAPATQPPVATPPTAKP